MRRTLPLALLLLAGSLAPASLRAEGFEASCRFAEKLADRWRLPDLGLRYLQALEAEGKIQDKDKPALRAAKISLLQMQVFQETEPAKRDALVKQAEGWVKESVDKVQADKATVDKGKPPGTQPRPPVSADEFREVLCYLRVLSAAARGVPDAGTRISRIHDLAVKTFHRIEESGIEDPDEKGGLMSEACMIDGLAVLGVRGAGGLAAAARAQVLQEGIESLQWAREFNEDPDHPEVVGFPAAYLGLAQCWRILGEEGGADAKKALEESRKLLNAMLSNPMNPNLPPAAQSEARYAAAKELLDMAFKAGALPEAEKTAQEFARKAPARGLGRDRATLLTARVDMEKSRALKASGSPKWEEARKRAVESATKIKESGGGGAWEADQLLSDWEGTSGASRRNWRGEASKALDEKNYAVAIRKFRAALASAGRDDRLRASLTASIGACYAEQGRFLEASTCFERAARICPSWENAGESAFRAAAYFEQATQAVLPKDLPPAATASERKALFLLLAAFPDHKAAPFALHQLGLLCYQERDYEGAERYLSAVPAAYARHLESLDFLAYARVDLVRRKDRAEGASPEMVRKALESNQAFLDKAKASAEAWVRKSAAEHAYLHIEILSLREPVKAVQLSSQYPQTYPEAKERIADLPRLSAVASAASGDWASAAASWDQAVKAAGDPKPGKGWPLLGTARTLQRLCDAAGAKGVKPASDLSAQISAQISRFQPFKFSEAAKRFDENFNAKRWAEAIVALEQIRENITDNPQAREGYMKDAGSKDWILFFEERYPQCYVETGDWAKAVGPLLKRQDLERDLKQLDKQPPGALLPQGLRKLWEQAATAATRVAVQMPKGEERKALADKACESWRVLLEASSVEDPRYWDMLLDATRAQVLAGRYGAAKDTVRGLWVTYPEMGGQKDRFVQSIRELQQSEPEFSSTATGILNELTGTGGGE